MKYYISTSAIDSAVSYLQETGGPKNPHSIEVLSGHIQVAIDREVKQACLNWQAKFERLRNFVNGMEK